MTRTPFFRRTVLLFLDREILSRDTRRVSRGKKARSGTILSARSGSLAKQSIFDKNKSSLFSTLSWNFIKILEKLEKLE